MGCRNAKQTPEEKMMADMMKGMEKQMKELQKQQEQQQKELKAEMERMRREVANTKADTQQTILRSSTGAIDEDSTAARAAGWKWVLKNTGVGGDTDPEMLGAFWEKYDVDKNGTLSKDEIKLVLMDVSKAKKEQLVDELPKIKEKMKKQQDPMGMVEAMIPMIEGEIKSKTIIHEKRAAGVIDEAEIDLIFKKMDEGNKDGTGAGDGKITKEEFILHATDILLAEEIAAKKMQEGLIQMQGNMEQECKQQ